MSFNSLEFLIFLPVVVTLYWICPHRVRWILLLGASYYFYMSWNMALGLLFFFITFITYLSGRMIVSAQSQRIKRLWLVINLVVSLGLLVFFKYFNFLAGNAFAVMQLLGLKGGVIFLNVILPVGISFYTFQAVSYVFDVYRGRIEPEYHFGYYALYVSFFPQLVAGPIERTENLLPQLKMNHSLRSNDIQEGLRLLLCGFFRKIVIADYVGKFVTSVYSNTAQADGGAVFVATILFSAQIYCDFQGYSEIAAGSARLMGIHLMKNFDHPYFAHSIRDFWRRWHISLTSWFTDYIYIPMGGSRNGAGRQIFAVFVVLLISGLWHGAAWTFVIWGLIHALYLIVEILLHKPVSVISKQMNGARKGKIKSLLEVAGTFGLVNFAWIFFRADTVQQAFYCIQKLFSPWNLVNTATSLNIHSKDVVQLLMILLMMPTLHYLTETPVPEGAAKLRINAMAVTYVYFIMVIALSWLIQLGQNEANAFIYFQF